MNDNQNTFNNIKKMIDTLEYYEAEYMQETINHLYNQFEVAGSAEWSRNDLKNYIFDNDIIDLIYNQGYVILDNFLEDIREIQHAIIMFFSADY